MSIEFHETVMGNRFFNSQLPRLIEAIEKIASLIEKSADEKRSGNKRLMILRHDHRHNCDFYPFFLNDWEKHFRDNSVPSALEVAVMLNADVDEDMLDQPLGLGGERVELVDFEKVPVV